MNLSQFQAKHGGSPAAQYAAAEREAALNGPTRFDPDLAVQLRIPSYVLYIYNVGPMEFRIAKGSAGPPGGYHIKACEKGKLLSEPLLIPSMVTDTYLQEDIAKTHSVTGEFMCQDIVHPALTDTSWSVGQNYDDFGVFWTKNKEPMPEERALAVAKMEKTFRGALIEANMLEATGRLDLITPLMRFAADYFEESRVWNRIYKRMAECTVCGGPMKDGVAIHSCGAVHNWAKAIFHGAKSYQDAKNVGAWNEGLEKQVEELRYLANRPIATAETNDTASSFLRSAELAEFENKDLDRAESSIAARPDPRQDVVSPARTRTEKIPAAGKKPPAPKRPKNFKA
jgi:hypothetical protein